MKQNGNLQIYKKAIFLDRDGIINQPIIKNNKPFPPKDISQLVLINGLKEFIILARKMEYLIIVITNQPDVSRGRAKKSDIIHINSYIKSELDIDMIYTCYCDDIDKCNNRKPGSGFFLKAQATFNLKLQDCYMIGDRWKDIDAGNNVGANTIFVDYEYDEKLNTRPNHTIKATDNIYNDVSSIIKNNGY